MSGRWSTDFSSKLMPTILPPPPLPSPQPTASPVPVVIVANPPVAITVLSNGTIVRAEIVAILARGIAEIKTELGNFQIRANFALRRGAELELQLLKSVPQVQFAIRSLDGHAPPGALLERGQTGAASQPTGTLTNTATPNQAGQLGERIGAAASLSPTQQGASIASPAGPPTVGSLIVATLLPRPPGIDLTGTGTPTAAPQTSNPATPTSPPSATLPIVEFGSARRDAAGSRIELRLISINASTQPPSTPIAGTLQPSPTVSGTVTAFTPNGRPIVDTPIGLLSLDTNADLRIGDRLAFSILPPTPRGEATLGHTGFAESFIQRRIWPTLEQALAHLTQRQHDAAAPATSPAIPQANNHLGANLISVMAALQDGDIRSWLGDAVALLQQERPDVSQRLSDEFAQLARLATEASKDDWRTAVVPFFNGANLEPVQMHLRGGKSQKGDKGGDGGSRFIIDLQLSNLGRFQLDGFIKERGDSKNLDLIVRTDDPLPRRMRHDINRIFTDFTDATGLHGGISFQAHAQFVDVPLTFISERGDNGLVV